MSHDLLHARTATCATGDSRDLQQRRGRFCLGKRAHDAANCSAQRLDHDLILLAQENLVSIRLVGMQTTTGKSKSFIEILESEIRSDLRQEIEAEVLARFGVGASAKTATASELASPAVHAAGRLETWLASNMGRTTFARTQAAQASYKTKPAARKATTQAPQAKAQAPTSPQVARFTAATAEQLCAVELLRRQSGVTLGASFTEDELKTVWRKAALKTHPDRFAAEGELTQMRMSAIFRELCESYELLLTAFEAQKAA